MTSRPRQGLQRSLTIEGREGKEQGHILLNSQCHPGKVEG